MSSYCIIVQYSNQTPQNKKHMHCLKEEKKERGKRRRPEHTLNLAVNIHAHTKPIILWWKKLLIEMEGVTS